ATGSIPPACRRVGSFRKAAHPPAKKRQGRSMTVVHFVELSQMRRLSDDDLLRMMELCLRRQRNLAEAVAEAAEQMALVEAELRRRKLDPDDAPFWEDDP